MDKIQTEDLQVFYGDRPVIGRVSLAIPQGGVTTLIGPSGCGKSTLLRCLNRMNDTVENCTVTGRILLDGEDINRLAEVNALRRRVGMVFQKPCVFPMSIYDNIAFALRLQGCTKKARTDPLVRSSLEKAALWTEVENCLEKSAFSLSGGQQQRLCIARALALSPQVLLMDEPTSALDPISSQKIAELITELGKTVTVVLVTHDLSLAKSVSQKTVFLQRGTVVEENVTEELFAHPRRRETADFLAKGL